MRGDQIGTPRGNSAGHATPNLGFRFLVDFWHIDVVHGIKIGIVTLILHMLFLLVVFYSMSNIT